MKRQHISSVISCISFYYFDITFAAISLFLKLIIVTYYEHNKYGKAIFGVGGKLNVDRRFNRHGDILG
jgi:hypothetical protein